MKPIRWDAGKNEWLLRKRGVSFEMVLFAIENDQLLDDLVHPNTKKYSNQRMLVVEIGKYAYLVPYVETEDDIFLKTIIPSRNATRKYLIKGLYE